MAHVVTGVVRRGGRAVRSLGPATVAVALALIIGAAGFADAATGGTFLLGRTNTDDATSVLTDTRGVPLSLNAPSGQSPLSVNSTTQVNRLNAQYLGGRAPSNSRRPAASGSPARRWTSRSPPRPRPRSPPPAPSRPGPTTSRPPRCSSRTGRPRCTAGSRRPGQLGRRLGTNYIQAAETTDVTVPANTVLSEVCYAFGTNQLAYDAAIMAIRVSSSSPGNRADPAPPPHRPRSRGSTIRWRAAEELTSP